MSAIHTCLPLALKSISNYRYKIWCFMSINLHENKTSKLFFVFFLWLFYCASLGLKRYIHDETFSLHWRYECCHSQSYKAAHLSWWFFSIHKINLLKTQTVEMYRDIWETEYVNITCKSETCSTWLTVSPTWRKSKYTIHQCHCQYRVIPIGNNNVYSTE